MHLVEGRNTGIPKAIHAIRANGSPLPDLLTDEDRSYFSVIMKIHASFLTQTERLLHTEQAGDRPVRKKRLRRDEIRQCILNELREGNKSLNEIYKNQGYTSSVSDAFRQVLKALIAEGVVEYLETEKNSPKSLLRIKRF